MATSFRQDTLCQDAGDTVSTDGRRHSERNLVRGRHLLRSSLGDEWIKKYRGDFDAFAKTIKQGVSGDTVTYDREKNVITMASDERTDCFCPLNGTDTPKVVCNCSLGWQKHTWETFFEKKVKVELKESVLRGGKRCVFEIRIDHAA